MTIFKDTGDYQDQWSDLLDSLVDDILEMHDEEVIRTFSVDDQDIDTNFDRNES